jgi:hypothetical protein
MLFDKGNLENIPEYLRRQHRATRFCATEHLSSAKNWEIGVKNTVCWLQLSDMSCIGTRPALKKKKKGGYGKANLSGFVE